MIRSGPVAPAGALRLPRSVVAVAFVALVGVNGLAPYLELKTATAWNMYSNVRIADGESNHLVVRRSIPLRGGPGDLVEIVDATAGDLIAYRELGWALPLESLNRYLAENPSVAVTYERDGTIHTASGLDGVDEPSLVAQKLAFLRAVDLDHPARCQRIYLPAG